jgi:hypothetical protein
MYRKPTPKSKSDQRVTSPRQRVGYPPMTHFIHILVSLGCDAVLVSVGEILQLIVKSQEEESPRYYHYQYQHQGATKRASMQPNIALRIRNTRRPISRISICDDYIPLRDI